MKQLSNTSIYDEKTGIEYELTTGGDWNGDETWEKVILISAHSGSEQYGLSFEKEEATTLWRWLVEQSE